MIALKVQTQLAVQFIVVLALLSFHSISFAETNSAKLENSLASQVNLRGQWIQGGLIMGTAPVDATILYNNAPLLQSETGQFIFGFGRDETGPAHLKIQHNGQTWEQTFPIQARKYKIQRIEGIAKKIMQPSAEDTARASAEAQLVRNARQQSRSSVDFLMGFQWPAEGRITGVYGSQRVYNGEPGRPHFGIDLAAPVGTPVYAPAPGIITLTHNDMFYSGGTLLIDHGLGLSSTMIHLSKIHVKEGEAVKTGQLIAEIGSTGRSTGPHLDWRLNWFDVRLDPELQVAER